MTMTLPISFSKDASIKSNKMKALRSYSFLLSPSVMAGHGNFATYIFFLVFLVAASCQQIAIDDEWRDAHATFYGDIRGGETMQGACGYGDLFRQGYGLATAALSTALFQDGLRCGACFEIVCANDPQWCYPHAGSIKITATNFCPPNYSKPNDNWCNPPQEHFDLSKAMFTTLAPYKAGIISVRYRRVTCIKSGGVKFEIKGNPNWILVLVYNVGGAGDVIDVKVKGSSGDWIQMLRNWGQNWQTGASLVGQSLSFRVTTSGRKTLEFPDVADARWRFGQTYDGKLNF